MEKSLQQKGFRIALDGFDGDYMGLHSVGEIGADVLKLDLRSLNKEKKSGSVQDVFDRAKTLRLTLPQRGSKAWNSYHFCVSADVQKARDMYFPDHYQSKSLKKS